MFSIGENPLTPNQTNVEWTHVLGGVKAERYVLLIERNVGGLWPSTMERYLQWMIDEFYETPQGESVDENQEVMC